MSTQDAFDPAAYVAALLLEAEEVLLEAGAKLKHRSPGRAGRPGSSYWTLPPVGWERPRVVRVSDHCVPASPERGDCGSMGGADAEVVVGVECAPGRGRAKALAELADLADEL